MNQYLDDLAMSNTKKDRPGMRKALQLLLRNTSALEQKWLIRIILKVYVYTVLGMGSVVISVMLLID